MAFSFKLPKLGAGAKDEAADQMTVSTAMSLEGAGSAMQSLLPTLCEITNIPYKID